MAGIKNREDLESTRLICLELSNTQFKKLKRYYEKFNFVKVYNLSSVSISKFPSIDEVEEFYNNRETNFNHASFDTIREWYRADISYIQESGKDIDGIEAIKSSLGLKYFDVVLIDGSEFTGNSELDCIIGADVIMLDDTESYKYREAFERLSADANYQLRMYEPKTRGGFAVFSKSDISALLTEGESAI